MKFTQEDLLNAMGLKTGDTVSVNDNYDDLFVGVVEVEQSHGEVGIRSQDTFLYLSEIIREGYEYSVIPQPKYTLTEPEKHIVLAIDEQWKWIARDEYLGCLFVFDEKPNLKEKSLWKAVNDCASLIPFNQHFQFIQWSDEEPVSLDELRQIAKGETK